jgi:arabinogalactan endo-1,4-beta-galactosidase
MKMAARFGCVGVLVTMLPGFASAQMGMHAGPAMRGILNPVVGSGGEYEMTTERGTKMVMEIAIVGKESVAGKDGYWFEMTMSTSEMAQMVSKTLTVVDGTDTITSRTILQMGNRPPMEMPTQMFKANAQKQPADIRDRAEDVGSETVTTPAGTFATEHYKMKDGSGDAWVAPKAGPYGLVKFQGKDSTMVLTKVTTDAKDKITGTPQPFNPMMFQQQNQHP